ncbi:MAG: hypothetical protein IKE68_02590, partial [Solobacterium sp.]|nr:hypothetical protein [Solobacterium sp.]
MPSWVMSCAGSGNNQYKAGEILPFYHVSDLLKDEIALVLKGVSGGKCMSDVVVLLIQQVVVMFLLMIVGFII